MYDQTREGAIIGEMSDDDKPAWWYLFRFYGAHEAIRLMTKWEV